MSDERRMIKNVFKISLGALFIATSIICPSAASNLIAVTQAAGTLLEMSAKEEDEKIRDTAEVLLAGSTLGSAGNHAASKNVNYFHAKTCEGCSKL